MLLAHQVPEWLWRSGPYLLAVLFGWPLLLLPYAIWREIKKRRGPKS